MRAVLPGWLDFLDEDVPRQRLRGRIGRVVHDQAVRAEDRLPSIGRTPSPCRRPARYALRNSLMMSSRNSDSGRTAASASSAAEMSSVSVSLRDRQMAGAGQIGELDGPRRQVGVEHRTAVHLGPVVIFGVDPEHRHDRDAVIARHLRGELHRRQRLQQREQRSAERARLLPGDHDARGGVGQPGGGVARRAWRAAAFLLRGDHARDLGGLARVRLRAGDGVGPGGRQRRVAGEERRDLLVRKRVVRRQTPNPGECANVHRERRCGCRRDVGRHRHVLSQTVTEAVNRAW